MRRQSVLNGVNVPIEPSANTANTITNNITINPETKVAYSTREIPVPDEENPIEMKESEITPKRTGTKPKVVQKSNMDLNQFLLELFSTILLHEDIKLIANIISDEKIILAKKDLEQVIIRKIHKPCKITISDQDLSCCGKPIECPYTKIASIRIIEEGDKYVDFKVEYNLDYIELEENYHISLKSCLNL
jgi:hypothetical protein